MSFALWRYHGCAGLVALSIALITALTGGISASAAQTAAPLCEQEACDRGCSALNPNFYGFCEASGCVCHELILPPDPSPPSAKAPKPPSGPTGCRACTVNQYCLVTGLGSSMCVDVFNKCSDVIYYGEHFCECEPQAPVPQEAPRCARPVSMGHGPHCRAPPGPAPGRWWPCALTTRQPVCTDRWLARYDAPPGVTARLP
jgi:hypothetical protein